MWCFTGRGPEIHNISAVKLEVGLFVSCKGGCGVARHVYISVLLKSSILLQLKLPFIISEYIHFFLFCQLLVWSVKCHKTVKNA